MSTPERFDDERIESLLVDFFRAEMPEEFREESVEPSVATTARPSSTVPGSTASRPHSRAARHRTPTGLIGLGVAGACLAGLFIASNVVRGPATNTVSPNDAGDLADVTPDPTRDEAVDDRPVFHLSEDDLFVESVEGHVENLDSERFETERGPVELRAVRETTNVSAFDPESGVGVDLETQILDIEIVPIDPEDDSRTDDSRGDRPTPRGDDPALPESDR